MTNIFFCIYIINVQFHIIYVIYAWMHNIEHNSKKV